MSWSVVILVLRVFLSPVFATKPGDISNVDGGDGVRVIKQFSRCSIDVFECNVCTLCLTRPTRSDCARQPTREWVNIFFVVSSTSTIGPQQTPDRVSRANSTTSLSSKECLFLSICSNRVLCLSRVIVRYHLSLYLNLWLSLLSISNIIQKHTKRTKKSFDWQDRCNENITNTRNIIIWWYFFLWDCTFSYSLFSLLAVCCNRKSLVQVLSSQPLQVTFLIY